MPDLSVLVLIFIVYFVVSTNICQELGVGNLNPKWINTSKGIA